MRVTCAPDSFKESISAVDAADAMALGIRQFSPQISIDCCPVGDGGDGTLESLLASIQGQLVPAEVVNQNGIVIESEIGVFDNGSLAFVESAKAIGIAFVAFTVFIYALIGWLSRTAQADAYYVAGRQVPTVFNGMATAADWMSGASFVAMAGGIYFKG